MKRLFLICFAVFSVFLFLAHVNAQEHIQIQKYQSAAVDQEALAPSRLRSAKPMRRASLNAMQTRTVKTGDGSVQQLGAIVVKSFKEQETFATRMNKADLVGRAILFLPEVEDEVLEFEDSYVIRRSTKIIVINPVLVSRESNLFRDYLGERPRMPVRLGVDELDQEEQAALKTFMTIGINELDPNDPIRAAARSGEQAVLDAIVAGKGALTIEDTLIIPKRMGLDQGADIRIPTIRDGVFDLKNLEPVKSLSIKSLGSNPMPQEPLKLKAIPIPKKEPPPRQPLKPEAKASGKKKITAEFLAGVTRSANFQWERKWEFPTGYFRITLGAGYAFGYRVPLVATASIEPTKAYIQDYSDKKVIIGVAGKLETVNGSKNYYKRVGLPANQLKNGKELLLEANVGYGYKLRALWKTRLYRPYTAIGISYSQNFQPPMNSSISCSTCDFIMSLDPKTTKMSLDLTLLKGTAWIRFDGKTAGLPSLNLKTMVDNKTQKNYALKNVETMSGTYPYKIVLKPIPLRKGTTTQIRPYGIRLTDPTYKARLVITPQIKLGLRIGYKKISRNFNTGWINLNSLRIDTGQMILKSHVGTPKEHVWNEGKKTYRRIKKPAGGLQYSSDPAPAPTPDRAKSKPARQPVN